MSNIYKILNTIQKLEDSVKENLTESVAEAKQAKEPFAVGMAAAKKKAGITKTPAHDLPKKVVKKGHEIGKAVERDLEEASKPDFIDLDKDGNKKESMKKAAADKRKVKESYDELDDLAWLSGLKDKIISEDTDVVKPNTGNPYEAGYSACEQGFGLDDNPYPEDHHLHSQWRKGWMECAKSDKHEHSGIKEGKCPKCDCAECECDEMEEGNEFSGALAAAKSKGAKEFEIDGKTYPVKEAEDVCTECGMQEAVCECGTMAEGHYDRDYDDYDSYDDHRGLPSGYCTACGEKCDGIPEDNSFDYDYGSISGKHEVHDLKSDCCGADMVDSADELPGQDDDDERVYESCMSAVPATPESEDNISVNTSYSSRDDRKTVTVTAEGEQAEALLQMLNLAGLGHSDHAKQAQAVVVAQEAKEYGDTEVDEAPEHANTPDPQIEDVDTIIDQGSDLHRKKSQHADKPKAGDNPLATKTEESVNPLDALGRRLLKMYEGIKAK